LYWFFLVFVHAFFFFQAEDGIRVRNVTGVQTCALPICIPEPELVIEVRDVLDLPGIDVVLQFHTRVGLERVRRLTGLQTGLQQVLGGRSSATGHGTVDELDVGVLLVEDVDECFQGVLFGTGGPPGEYLDLVAAVIAAIVTTATAAPGKGEAGRGNSSD